MIGSIRRPAAVFAATLFLLGLAATPAAANPPSWSHRDARVCGQAGHDDASCTSIARTFFVNGHRFEAHTKADLEALPMAAQPVWFHGPDLRTAYGITGQGDPSRVVAIVDAFDDPNAFAYLTRFRTDQSLPAMSSCSLAALTSLTSSSTNPCFTKVNQSGGTTLPTADAGWSNEIDLDLQAVSSICPTCSILLLEASSASVGNLAAATTTASNTAHVLAISNSYGISGDYPGSFVTNYDNAAKKGIAVTASAGDRGFGILFPASATNVIGVGGTTLFASETTGVRTSETAWSSTGSGCSVYNAKPSWQVIPNNPCGSKKAVSDLSADADPGSGLAIYTTYGGTTGYWVFGGTSLSSPLIAALYTIQGGYNSTTLASQYAWAAGTPYFDVTSGSNATSCSPTVLCTAGTGWDGPTGRGSIATASAPAVLTSVSVTPTSASVQVNGTQQFTATAKDQNGQPMNPQPGFSWAVDGGGSISSGGLFTAGGGAGGPFTVTASTGGVDGTASVTVTPAPVLTSITVSPASASVQAGKTQQFSATAKDQFGQAMSPQPAFTWGVSGGGSISSGGLFTAGGTAGGPFTVTASSGGVDGMASVTVTPAPVGDFSLTPSPSSRSIRSGSSTTFTVTVNTVNGFAGSVTLAATGLPSGATASFSPNPTTGTSILTIRTVSGVRGTFTITITGTSGTLQHTTTVSLVIKR